MPLSPELEKFITWGIQISIVGAAGFVGRKLQKFGDDLYEFKVTIQGIVKDFNWHSTILNNHTIEIGKLKDKNTNFEARISVLERSHQCTEQ